MYEQCTDKQIVEMLMPKLVKPGWGSVDSNELYPDTIEMIATTYRLAYTRGQLGQSFIIGKKADTNEHWVSANGGNIKEGDAVRYINEIEHEKTPEYYPAKDAVGKVIKVCFDGVCCVQWPNGSTSRDDKWCASFDSLEVLLYE